MDRSLLFPETTSFISSEYVKRVAHLRSKITTFAYEQIKMEITEAWQYDENEYKDNNSCICSLRHAFMLPCRHIIPREAIPVPFSIIGRRWIICDEVLENVVPDQKGK
jgi:hypothetical protein